MDILRGYTKQQLNKLACEKASGPRPLQNLLNTRASARSGQDAVNFMSYDADKLGIRGS